MISASEIHELRFEKAAFGYKQEDIDEFLNRSGARSGNRQSGIGRKQ